MRIKEHIRRVIQLHGEEAEEEYHRDFGDDPIYDQITWRNIEPYLPRNGRILDAGGGTGVWSIKMAQTTKCRVLLLEITPQLLTMAKKRIRNKKLTGRIEVLHRDIRNLPHRDRGFHFILCEADPISLCGNPEKAVGELSRVLKPKCHLVAGVDSTISRTLDMLKEGQPLSEVLRFLDRGIPQALEGASFNSKSFTPRELVTLLRKYGLETVRIVGKPIGSHRDLDDPFFWALPPQRRQQVFENPEEKRKLATLLYKIYDDPYVSGIGSHLQVVAVKKDH